MDTVGSMKSGKSSEEMVLTGLTYLIKTVDNFSSFSCLLGKTLLSVVEMGQRFSGLCLLEAVSSVSVLLGEGKYSASSFFGCNALSRQANARCALRSVVESSD